MTEKLTGLALLDAAIEQIKDHPETWEQSDFRCETGLCVGGWVCALAGGTWMTDDLRGFSAWYLLAEPGDPEGSVLMSEGRTVVAAAARAERLIGAPHHFFAFDEDGDSRRNLFAGGNELEDILRIRDEIAAWFATQEPQRFCGCGDHHPHPEGATHCYVCDLPIRTGQ